MAFREVDAEEVREVRHPDLRREQVAERAGHRQPRELRPAESEGSLTEIPARGRIPRQRVGKFAKSLPILFDLKFFDVL